MNKVIINPVWVHCRACACDTRHLVRGETAQATAPDVDQLMESNEGQLLFVWVISQIIECDGCGRTRFRKGWTSTPQLERTWAWRIYANHQDRSHSPAVNRLPTKVGKLYRETLQAFRCGALTLATVGIRSVVEAIVCSDRCCKGVDLRQKIRKLGAVLSAADVTCSRPIAPLATLQCTKWKPHRQLNSLRQSLFWNTY